MGELQDRKYNDDYEGLTYEEINALYGFDEDGGLVDDEYNSEEEEESDETNNYEECVSSEMDIEV